jgi:hypothetical protein
MNKFPNKKKKVTGKFINLAGDRYYAIRNVDMLPPFFISVISDSDHWLFVSSAGGLTAGRVSPQTALFPYITVDKIHESGGHTGGKTLLRVTNKDGCHNWEPFNRDHDSHFVVGRHLYKNLLGNKIRFEEVNHDLQLAFRYTWVSSDTYGFARQCELQNLGEQVMSVDMLDGMQNILPAGTPLATQTNASNLVDAYKWNELDEQSGLAYFTLYSGISDRAEPCESLKASTVFCLGLESPKVMLCSEQLENFRRGEPLQRELHKRGVRGAYLVNTRFELEPNKSQYWQLVANIEQTQSQVAGLRRQLGKPLEVAGEITSSVARGTDKLARIVAGCDGFQVTAQENVSAHHYSNAVFNLLRGGVFDDQYQVSSRDFAATLAMFNRDLYQRHATMLDNLPGTLDVAELQSITERQGDPQLDRLFLEYLPITFGRRHGDPSRPWNQFAIKLRDQNGGRLLSYQGNWRDIFQNWEALTFSYPEYIESVIAKFVNASTMDGYNPYRIAKEGIDWEVEEPDNPWSYIGYWGDHQIIYLLKLLELSKQFHPEKLGELLHRSIFCYANVPYRIKPLSALLKDAKSTVEYDTDLANQIAQRVAKTGADGKLVVDGNGEVYQVNLLEKLLVPLLCKLGNLVIDGGIWLNTQRPEWNDANNALVGQGLSLVTLYHMRRYLCFLQELLLGQQGTTTLSLDVSQWLSETADALAHLPSQLAVKPLSAEQRYRSMMQLGEAASRYRLAIYHRESFTDKVDRPIGAINAMLADALAAIDHTISVNQRNDGLYHAYKLLNLQPGAAELANLYPMLEGQVALLSSGALDPEQAASVLEALFESDIYRHDQKTFMLYPDRQLPGFLARNCLSFEQVKAIPLLERMLALGDESALVRDVDGKYHFNAEFTNIGDLDSRLEKLIQKYGDEFRTVAGPLRLLYEQVFNHQAFTGRSGGMFGFEGLGCVYWHMVAKLLFAVQETFFTALEQSADRTSCRRLGELYYRVREGIGFNKTPTEFGAFPHDPYSHTPRHAGAQQPGMTGQVKEELLTRFGELGIRVNNGVVSFVPALLRACEFISQASQFRYLDVDDDWQELIVQQVLKELTLPPEASAELFKRSGRIRRLTLSIQPGQLFAG